MKKIVLLLLGITLFALNGQAQTTAMDFNQADCDGIQHHLFSELDAGSVVVISFVMMNCSSCIVATNELKTITSGYSSSHPGRVKLYSMGYLNSYTCTQMNNWRTIGGFTHPVFTGGQAQTAYYGGMGMPTIVVLATNDHTVLYKKLGYTNTDKPAIIAAINSGLTYTPAGIEEAVKGTVQVYPALVSDKVTIKLGGVETGFISITDLTGQEVLKKAFSSVSSFAEDISFLPGGMYIVGIYNSRGRIHTTKIIKN